MKIHCQYKGDGYDSVGHPITVAKYGHIIAFVAMGAFLQAVILTKEGKIIHRRHDSVEVLLG